MPAQRRHRIVLNGDGHAPHLRHVDLPRAPPARDRGPRAQLFSRAIFGGRPGLLLQVDGDEEGVVPREDLVEDHAERPHVCAAPDRLGLRATRV